MADGIPITPGSGATIWTDDVAGGHKQMVGLADGTDGGTARIGGDATNGLDVDVTRVQGTVAVNPQGTANQFVDTTATWANSAAVNTIVNIDVTFPSPPQVEGRYTTTIVHPSTVTDLKVIWRGKASAGTIQYPELTQVTHPKSTTAGRDYPTVGWHGTGGAGRIALSNDTVLGAAEGFTCYVKCWRI